MLCGGGSWMVGDVGWVCVKCGSCGGGVSG